MFPGIVLEESWMCPGRRLDLQHKFIRTGEPKLSYFHLHWICSEAIMKVEGGILVITEFLTGADH